MARITTAIVMIGSLHVAAIAEEQTGDVHVSGRVVDADGQPISTGEFTIWKFADERTPRWVRAATGSLEHQGQFAIGDLEAPVSLLLTATAAGYASVHKHLHIDEAGEQKVELSLAPAAPVIVDVRDASGRPATGIRLRSLRIEDANGANSLDMIALRDLVRYQAPTGRDGRLTLPDLPVGSLVELNLLHPDFAPAQLADIRVDHNSEPVALQLEEGVPVTLHVASRESGMSIDHVEIDVRHEPFSHPSTLVRTLLPVHRDGTVRFTLEAGSYRSVWLRHPDLLITPLYTTRSIDGEYFEWERSDPPRYDFALHQKVTLEGRVVDRLSGEPIADTWIQAQIPNHRPDGTVPPGSEDWAHTAWARTDAEGRYRIDAAEGPVRLWFEGEGYSDETPYREVNIDSSTGNVGPTFELTPLRPVEGRVLAPDGTPAAGVVVRFRGSQLRHRQPVITDDEGRFQLEMRSLPIDYRTNQRALRQPIVAYHPHEPWAVLEWVELDEPLNGSDIVLPLAVDPSTDLIQLVADDLSLWEREEVDADRLAPLREKSLIGKPCPPLDGRAWLNTGGRQRSLPDIRGRHVLLVFWTTWCGPCHADFPSVKLVQELYGDRGLEVVGIHDNSVAPDAIAAHVDKEGLTFPIVIDHTDGRIVKSFEAHGIVGYPSYVLIGPDGRVLAEDRTQPGPSLRVYKLELIRKLLGPGHQVP